MKTNKKQLDNTRKYRQSKIGVLTNLYWKMWSRNSVDFTLAQFHERYLNDRKYGELFLAWKKLGFPRRMIKPSIDRINHRLPYTFENIRIVSWEQNRYKGDIEVALQKTKPVIMMCMNGIFVHQFDSIESAVRLTGYNQSLISSCCTGKRKYTGDFKFKFGNLYEHPQLTARSNEAIR